MIVRSGWASICVRLAHSARQWPILRLAGRKCPTQFALNACASSGCSVSRGSRVPCTLNVSRLTQHAIRRRGPLHGGFSKRGDFPCNSLLRHRFLTWSFRRRGFLQRCGSFICGHFLCPHRRWEAIFLAVAFLVEIFLVATFLAVTFLVATLFVAAFFAAVVVCFPASSPVAAIRNAVRSLAPASHIGVRPRPRPCENAR
jgi:hypothetical protein